MPPGPPPPHHHHHVTPPPPGPGFPPFFPPFGRHFRPSHEEGDPFGRNSLKDLKYFFILSVLLEMPNGITGYQLQGQFGMGRGNIVRLLDEIREEGWVDVTDETIDGRAQKRFKINEKGTKYLEELKRKWAEKFAQMAEMAPVEEYGNPNFFEETKEQTLHRLASFSDKEDAVDYIRGIRSRIKKMKERTQRRLDWIDKAKIELDELIAYIDQQPTYNAEKVMNWLKSKKNE
jgi:DNA-binding PadR family transcriptional regulator